MSATTPEAAAGRPSDPDAEDRFWESVRLEFVEAGRSDPAAEAAAARVTAAADGWLCIEMRHPAIRGACLRLGIRHNRMAVVAYLIGEPAAVWQERPR